MIEEMENTIVNIQKAGKTMEITRSLLRPLFERLRAKYQQLGDRVRMVHPVHDEEALGLQALTESKAGEIEALLVVLDAEEDSVDDFQRTDLQEAYHRLKAELRLAERRWLRFLSHEARIRRMEEKRRHVAPFAA